MSAAVLGSSGRLRFAPDCGERYELELKLGPAFGGNASFGLSIQNVVATTRNPWTQSAPRFQHPPPPPLPDPDDDGLHDAIDTCPLDFDPTDWDSEGDGIGDVCDNCRVWPNSDQADTDRNGLGNSCECGDQDGNGRVSVTDPVAINLAIFNPALVTPLCDTNDDDLCNVGDIVGANLKIFGAPAWCARNPRP